MTAFHAVDPKQSFPELELRVLERWRESDVFGRSLANREGAETWSFYEGPPTANGRPHAAPRPLAGVQGHLPALQDDVRLPGAAQGGLGLPRAAGRARGRARAGHLLEGGDRGLRDRRVQPALPRVGVPLRRGLERAHRADRLLDRPRRPLLHPHNDYIESVWWALRRIWDDGRLYEAHKVVPYCPRCGTALSSHEVALGYHDVEDPSVYVKLPIREPAPSDEIPESPLQPGDSAAGLDHDALDADLQRRGRRRRGDRVRAGAARGRGRWCWPTALVEKVLGEDAEVLARFPGEALAGTAYEPPFDYITDYGPRGHTVLLGDFVSTEEGTGLVHTAIAFGEDDFRLGEQYGITLQNPVKLGRHLRRADHRLRRPLRQGGRPRHRQGAGGSAAGCCAPRPTCTPTRTAGAATRRCSTTRSRAGTSAPPTCATRCWPPTSRSAGTPSTSSTAASASGWRTTSTGRSRGTATGARRCRSGSATQPTASRRFCAGSIADLREKGAEVPDDLHRPYIDEVAWACEAEGCDGTMRRGADRDRRLV